jgi:hypothetical protein
MVEPMHSTHNGVGYTGVEDKTAIVTGSVVKGKRKWLLKGHPVINRTAGSYKHGDEVQIVVWNKPGSTIEKARVLNARWDRLEIFFPVELWDEMIKEYVLHNNAARSKLDERTQA